MQRESRSAKSSRIKLSELARHSKYLLERHGMPASITVCDSIKDVEFISEAHPFLTKARVLEKLYHGFVLNEIPAYRWVTCKKKKHRMDEFVITNYQPALGAGGAA